MERAADGADDGVTRELLPPAFRLPVVHHKVRVAKLPGRSEIQNTAIDHPLEHQRRVARRAVGDDNGCAADGVVCFSGHQIGRPKTALRDGYRIGRASTQRPGCGEI